MTTNLQDNRINEFFDMLEWTFPSPYDPKKIAGIGVPTD